MIQTRNRNCSIRSAYQIGSLYKSTTPRFPLSPHPWTFDCWPIGLRL